jgi:hypothetical protein
MTKLTDINAMFDKKEETFVSCCIVLEMYSLWVLLSIDRGVKSAYYDSYYKLYYNGEGMPVANPKL